MPEPDFGSDCNPFSRMPFSDSAEPRRCLIFAGGVLRCLVANPPKEALTALADALAKRPVEELLFDWFRSGGAGGSSQWSQRS